MIDIKKLTMAEFKELPLVIEGESKEVRYAGDGLVVIRFKPTIYSFTHNRCAEVPGSEIPRLRASKKFVEVLATAGIRHAYIEVTDEWVLAHLVMPHQVEFDKYGIPPFVPLDLTEEQIAALPKAPPIEIIAKRYLTGTTSHGLVGIRGSKVRASHPFYSGVTLEHYGALPEMFIRFDWRNPLTQPGRGTRMADQILSDLATEIASASAEARLLVDMIRARISAFGDRVADAVLPLQLADLFIDVEQAKHTAFMTGRVLEDFLATKHVVFYDLCMFIDEAGTMVYGEISPDCGRYRHLDHGELDKDVWRSGGSSEDVINKWMLLCELIGVEV